MSFTTPGPGASPVPVVDVDRIIERLRRALADPANDDKSYTDIYSANKTDLGNSPGVAVTADRAVLNTDMHAVIGWSISETTGTAAASVRLYDGGNTSGEQFGRINLQANESVRDWFIPRGIRCYTGRVFLHVITGSVEGVVYWI